MSLCFSSLYVEMPLSVTDDKRNDTGATSHDQATLKNVKRCLIFQHLPK